jgi:translation initiation factor eIF-2B subunit delta
LSASSTIRRLAEHLDHPLEWIVAESRPGGEGTAMAADLAALGTAVTLVPDSAFPAAAATTEGLVIGIDALLSGSLVHKTGTRPAALACHSRGVEVWCLGGPEKWLPEIDVAHLGVATAPPRPQAGDTGVRQWRPLYDETPADWVTGFAAPDGIRPLREVDDVLGAFWDRVHIDALRCLCSDASRQATT